MNYTYLLIYLIKAIGGTLANYRLILINEGNKIGVLVVSFVSTITWIFSISLVVDKITTDPFIALPFVAGTITGNYSGAFLAKRFKTGTVLTTVITSPENDTLLEAIKASGFEVTSFKAEGKDDNKKLIMIASSKKTNGSLIDIIRNNNENNFIIKEMNEEVY